MSREYSTEDEIKRLRHALRDLASIPALSAVWAGAEPIQIAGTLLDALTRMLSLELVYVRLSNRVGGAPIEMVRVEQNPNVRAQDIGAALDLPLDDDPRNWPHSIPNPVGDGNLSILPLRLGLNDEVGLIVAGSRREDFPQQTERLLLSVAANQAAIGLHEAWLLSEQKRVANELDRRVAQRTAELAAANEALKKEVAERTSAEEKLRLEEHELKRSEARNAAILDSALDCIVTIDHEGRITEFNPAAERALRYPDLTGRHLSDIVIPSPPSEFANFLETGDEVYIPGKRIEMQAIRGDGSAFPVEVGITRIPLDGPPTFTAYLRDITERKQSEEELRRGQVFLEEAQRLSVTGSVSWSVATDEIKWSEQLYRIFEFDQDVSVTFALIASRVHADDVPRLEEMIRKGRAGESRLDYEHRLVMPDGSIKYLHLLFHRTRDKRGELEYIGAVQDVTRHRVSEDALNIARSDLAHVTRVTSLGVLTASIAHELNQPLSGVMTNAGTGLRMLMADPPNVDGALETMRRTIRDGNRAAEMITRLRNLFTKKSAATELLDLNEATQEVVALYARELERNKVVLRTDFAEDLPQVDGDRVQLQQVVMNLVVNASEAMREIDDRPRQLVIRTERDDDDRARLMVQDSGVGFESHAADRLFEAFYTTKREGMGIGLSVSRSIIEQHRGRLWAAANEGPGVTFSFAIPRAAGNENAQQAGDP